MNSRSSILSKEKERLERKEALLKDELESVSSDMRSRAKTIGTFVLIAGGLTFVAYKSIRALSSKKPSEKTLSPQKGTRHAAPVKPKSSGISVKNFLMEKVASIAVKFIGAQIAIMLSKKFNEDSDTEKQGAGS